MELKDLEREIQTAPLLPTRPEVTVFGKRIVIKIADTQLLDQTTYRLSLGNALVDNREANPYPSFTYTFSTGNYFDTMEIRGKILDAATGLPDSAATLLLYDGASTDSVVFQKRPLYAIKADASGFFHQPFLPDRTFKVFAINDANNNLIYDPGTEKVAFLDSLVRPSQDFETPVLLSLFQESPVLDTGKEPITDTSILSDTATADTIRSAKPSIGERRGTRASKGKPTVLYRVNVDTMDLSKRSLDITQPLIINLFNGLQDLDKGKIYLTYDNGGIEIEAVSRLNIDSASIELNTDWQEDKVYTLRLVSGWAKDSTDTDLPPAKYFFRTMRTSDYASASITIDSAFVGTGFVLYVYKNEDSIYQQPITRPEVILKLMPPGEYGMRIIADVNGNGRWDSGNLLQRKQPEEVFPYIDKMALKAGWDNETHFKPADKQEIEKASLPIPDQHVEEIDAAPNPEKPPAVEER